MYKGKKESEPSLKPPKEWWDKTHAKISKENPSYSKEQVDKTVGNIWYNEMSSKQKGQKRKAEGKKYGKAPVKKAIDMEKMNKDVLVKTLEEKFAGKTPSEAEIKEELQKALKAGYETAAPEVTSESEAPKQEEPKTKMFNEGLFKDFSLGSTLKQVPTGNVMAGVKPSSIDYVAQAKVSKNKTYTAQELAAELKKK